ncbi:MAG: DUF3805 domain-containing protein [Mucilaginibacter sp.]|uniref:DUF3805 domain-containing protein n=1 Tax=Mucilaginibacter sp. TaxID=1882438 RepID=UPI003264C370
MMMDYIKYVSDGKWFTCDIPSYWTAFKEDESTALFYDDDDWKGNLRITPNKFPGANLEVQINKIETHINDEFDHNNDAKKLLLGTKKAIHYLKYTGQDSDSVSIHWWLVRDVNILFLCSFAVDTSREKEDEVMKEFEFARQVLISLKAS